LNSALKIAHKDKFYEVNLKAPLLLALSLMGGRRGIYRLNVGDDEGGVKGVISGLHILECMIGERGRNLLRKHRGRLDRFLQEPVHIFMEDWIHKLSGEFNLESVINYIVENKVGHILLLDKDQRLVGVVTESCISERLPVKKYGISVMEIMTSPVYTIAHKATLIKAVELMTRHKIRRIPVMVGDRLEAIISVSDILRYIVKAESHIEAMISKHNFQDYLKIPLYRMDLNKPLTLCVEDDVGEAIEKFRKFRVGGFPVLSSTGELYGILTDRDIVTKMPKIKGIKEFVALLQES